jgi:oligopeptide transport system substrate-binding protein
MYHRYNNIARKVKSAVTSIRTMIATPGATPMYKAVRRFFAFTVALAIAATPALGLASTLVRGIGSEPESFDPHKAVGTSASVVIYDLFEGLVTVDASGEAAPGAAESWTTNADRSVYTFRLRPNLKWSDGTPLTAEDFVYSMRRLLAPETAARYASFLYVIKGARAVNTQKAAPETLAVRAPDPRTVVFELEAPAPQFLEILTGVAAVAVPRHVIEKFGREWTRPGNLVSSGAYRLVDYSPNTFIKAKRNPNFHSAAAVKIDDVTYLPIEDDNASLKRFQSGELDVTQRFPPEQLDKLRREKNRSLRVAPGRGSTMLALNTRNKPFDDARVRQALALALDRDVLTGRILRKTAEPAYFIVPSSISGYDSGRPDWAAQPITERQRQARALLAQAGYGPGKPLRFTMQYYTESKTRTLAVAMVSMWRAVGVNCELINKDLGSVISSVNAGNYQVSLYAWYSSFDDPYTFLDLFTVKPRGSITGYSNPQYDAAVRAANRLPDPAERSRALAAAEVLMMRDMPAIPLFFAEGQKLVGPRVGGWIDNARGANLSRYLTLRG